MTQQEVIEKYISFFKEQGHTIIPNSPLVLQNDPTTLFTSAGMQPLLPYLLGETHQGGKRLVNVQNCLRSQDIEEVGDNRHTTFFRMMGNWSLGDYFKKEQLRWFFTFLTDSEKGLGLQAEKLFVTVFAGNNTIPQDRESIEIWRELFAEKGIDAKLDERIFQYDEKKNWWSRSGVPENMPAGEPGGPDSEVFYDFGEERRFHENSDFADQLCHVNCDCGRFMEIGNSVFMQYIKKEDGNFEELPQKNVDFGGGLERLMAAINDDPDVFTTESYKEIIEEIEQATDASYNNPEKQKSIRIIADHIKAATFLIVDGVRPSNKEHGYVLRRLLRRAAVKMYLLGGGLTPIPGIEGICDAVLRIEGTWHIDDLNHINRARDRDVVFQVIKEEIEKFSKSLDKGLKLIEKTDLVDADFAFNLYQSHGFPVEITLELLAQKGKTLDIDAFTKAFEEHKNASRTASVGKFKGGLADHTEETVKGHTATHLLHQALRDVLGKKVHQTGSNITPERVRFDFNYDRALTKEQLAHVEDIVNEKIEENLPVFYSFVPLEFAQKLGAIGLFIDKYENTVKIYWIGGDAEHPETAYSKEFCGGPHVDFTGKLKSFTITKEESLGAGQRRIYAVVGNNS